MIFLVLNPSISPVFKELTIQFRGKNKHIQNWQSCPRRLTPPSCIFSPTSGPPEAFDLLLVSEEHVSSASP